VGTFINFYTLCLHFEIRHTRSYERSIHVVYYLIVLRCTFSPVVLYAILRTCLPTDTYVGN